MRDGTVRGFLRSMDRSVPGPCAVRHLAAGWTGASIGGRGFAREHRDHPLRQFPTKVTAHRPVTRQSRCDRMRGGGPAGRADPFPASVSQELGQTDLAAPGRCVICTVTTSCWPRAFADNIKPAGAPSIAKGSDPPCLENDERIVARRGFSGLLSSLGASAKTTATAPTILLERCIGRRRVREAKTRFGVPGQSPRCRPPSNSFFNSASAPCCRAGRWGGN